ncbi:MAG: P-type conjugative transfer protein TrbL [Methylococcaceae bacterium]
MKNPILLKFVKCSFPLWLWAFSTNAYAAISNKGILDDVLSRYSTAASTWGTVITAYASWLFWTLTLISMVWTFGMMILRKADIGEFFAEFIRFTVFTGFFFWLLTNGPKFAIDIQDSLLQIGGKATGTGATFSPSGIVDIGFDIFGKVYDNSSTWTPVDSTVGIIISLIILVVLALVAVNMLVLLISGWILAYAGIFFLGFGGSRWTSDMAISYFKTVLSIAAQLLTMVLLVGIGKSFIDQYYTNMNQSYADMKELGIMLIVSVVLLALVNKLPPLIGQIPMGGGTGAIGNGLGTGAAMAAAAMGAAAVATAGAAVMGGLTSMAGGGSAIKAAYDKAQANMGGDGGGAMPSFGGSGSTVNGGGVSALASAMGDDSNGAMPSFGSSGSTMNSSNDSGGFSDSTGSDSGTSAGPDAKGNAQDGTTAAKTGKGGSTSTIANLAQGAMDVARANLTERIGETTGGRIAAAIRASGQGAETNTSSTFNDNSLSAGTSEPVDPESEIAAFRDRNSQTA